MACLVLHELRTLKISQRGEIFRNPKKCFHPDIFCEMNGHCPKCRADSLNAFEVAQKCCFVLNGLRNFACLILAYLEDGSLGKLPQLEMHPS